MDQETLTLESLEGHGLGLEPQRFAQTTPQKDDYSKVLLLALHRLQAQVTSLSKDLQELKGIVHEIHRSV